MQIHPGTIPTDVEGGTRIFVRVTLHLESTEDDRYLGFAISKEYTPLSHLPPEYARRTNALLVYIAKFNPVLDHALWEFYKQAHGWITKPVRPDRLHRIPARLGLALLRIFTEPSNLDTIFDFIDVQYPLEERRRPAEDEFLAFGLISGLMLPVFGGMAGVLRAVMEGSTIDGCLARIVQPLFSLPQFCHLPAIIMASVNSTTLRFRGLATVELIARRGMFLYYLELTYAGPIAKDLGVRGGPIRTMTQRLHAAVDTMLKGDRSRRN